MKPEKKSIALIQLRDSADIITVIPVAKHYYDLGFEIYFPISPTIIAQFRNSVNYISWISLPFGCNLEETIKYIYTALNELKCDYIIWLNEERGFEYNNFRHISNALKFDEFQYWIAGVPFEKKWNLVLNRNREREDALYDKIVNSDQFLVVYIDEAEFNNLNITKIYKQHQIIKIENQTDNKFDWLKIIENAKHLILKEGFYSNLVEQLNLFNSKNLILSRDARLTETRRNHRCLEITNGYSSINTGYDKLNLMQNHLALNYISDIQSNKKLLASIDKNQTFEDFTSEIIIVVTTFNRSLITQICLQNLNSTKHNATLVVLDDHSTDYSISDLKKWSKSENVVRFKEKMHIDKLRAKAHEIGKISGAKYIYHTDNDSIHDPNWLMRLYEMNATGAPLMSLFNSKHHENFTIKKLNHYVIRSACPGISFFYKIAALNEPIDFSSRITGREDKYLSWDFTFGNKLGVAIISSTSYVEHFGADGIHSQSFEDDTAINPSNWLQVKRKEILQTIIEAQKS